MEKAVEKIVDWLQVVTARLIGLNAEHASDVGLGIWGVMLLAAALFWMAGRRYQRKQDGDAAYKQLDSSYLALYESALDHPAVIDPHVTYHFDALEREQRLRYEAYAYRVWVVCETIYDALGLAREPTRLQMALYWLPTVWLRGMRRWRSPPDTSLAARREPSDSGSVAVRTPERSFEADLRRMVFIAHSQLNGTDWTTWRSALDIEARLHIKWFLAEGRFKESFKLPFKLGILRRFGGKLDELEESAKSRYATIPSKRVLDDLDPVVAQARRPVYGLGQMNEARLKGTLERWWPPAAASKATLPVVAVAEATAARGTAIHCSPPAPPA